MADIIVSTHSRPKAAELAEKVEQIQKAVSTHSRPKAAEVSRINMWHWLHSFNTQPPEGG